MCNCKDIIYQDGCFKSAFLVQSGPVRMYIEKDKEKYTLRYQSINNESPFISPYKTFDDEALGEIGFCPICGDGLAWDEKTLADTLF